MRDFLSTRKWQRLSGELSPLSKIVRGNAEPRQSSLATAGEAELLSAALCSLISRDAERVFDAHGLVDEARVRVLL